MIQVIGLTKQFGPQLLFDNASFVVGKGEKIGLVGRNGSGKSTFLRMVKGQIHEDGGTIAIPKDYRMAGVDQHIHFSHPTVREEVCSSLPANEAYDHYKAEKVLFGLGFSDADMGQAPGSFSGGYQVRINLAKALVQNPDMLLLDEPTNYLDIISLRWLRRFLVSFPGEVILITHDRDFMDQVVTHIVGISRKNFRKVKGDTLKYYEQVVQEEEIHEKTRLNQEKKKKELQSFIDRFRAKASKAAQAQSKMKQMDRMGSMERLESESVMGFRFHYKATPAKVIGEVNHLSFGYQAERPLFKNLNFAIGARDRIGIIGKNGKGKSTLLNVLAGNLSPLDGDVKWHHATRLGHFGQTNVERLHPGHTIAQEIQLANSELGTSEVRSIAGAMLFEGDLADKKVSVLSGGEKSRVMLGKIIAHSSNLLLLDEPTNHLDMESIEVLTDEVDRFPGAVVIVTHSEMLLRALVNRLIIFHHDKCEYFHGDYDDFLKKVGWGEEERPTTKKSKQDHKEIKRLRSDLVNSRSRELRPLKEEQDQLENEITQLEELLDKFNGLLQEKSGKGEDVMEMTQKVGQIHIKIEEKFSRLEEIGENIHQIESKYQEKMDELLD